MKKHFVILAFFALSFMHLATLSTRAQQESNTKDDSNLPPSFGYELKKAVPLLEIPFPVNQKEDLIRLKNQGQGMTASHTLLKKINIKKEGVCEKLPNGDRIWRLKITTDEIITDIYFDQIELPPGADIYWYSEGKGIYFNMKNSNKKNNTIKGSYLIRGKHCAINHNKSIILEYYEKKGSKGKAVIKAINVSYSGYAENMQFNNRFDVQYLCSPDITCACGDYNCPIDDYLKELLATSVVRIHIYKDPLQHYWLFEWRFCKLCLTRYPYHLRSLMAQLGQGL